VLGANKIKITAVLAHNVAQNMWHMLEDEARANKEETAKFPDKFKSHSNWRIFAESMETNLSHCKVGDRIPLKYKKKASQLLHLQGMIFSTIIHITCLWRYYMTCIVRCRQSHDL